MTIQQRTQLTHRTTVRALRPARVALILDLEYRRVRRQLQRERALRALAAR